MATVDIVTTTKRAGYPGKGGNPNARHIVQRKFTGAELNAAGTPSADTFKFAEIKKGQLVREVITTVLDADANAITLDIGYIDDNGSSATAFETNAALNATGVTASSDDQLVMSTDGFLTITVSAAIENATEFIVSAEIEDYSLTLRDNTLAAAI